MVGEKRLEAGAERAGLGGHVVCGAGLAHVVGLRELAPGGLIAAVRGPTALPVGELVLERPAVEVVVDRIADVVVRVAGNQVRVEMRDGLACLWAVLNRDVQRRCLELGLNELVHNLQRLEVVRMLFRGEVAQTHARRAEGCDKHMARHEGLEVNQRV